ncbi:MAG: ferrous iron transport protein B [Prevotellaceae bacterium]|jgi:ferrous iron transport protein B|nr:ferrous iron transport protein B [Prevotellaceae bacterium]
MRLSNLANGEKGVICKVFGRGAFRKRITEMGFVKGKVVLVVKNAPLKDPIEYSIMDYAVSLRRSEASMIEVVTEEEAKKIDLAATSTATIEQALLETAKVAGDVINVAFVGNPNTGKTSLFNQLSGAHEHVGNYSGVTVELKKAQVKLNGYTINLVDLPGTYSLTAYSPEEVYVRKYIAEEMPDVIVNVVDATNLERNLYLTTQLIDMDVKVIMALNMYDELTLHNDHLDHEALGRMLGIPIIPTVGSRGKGMKDLLQAAIDAYEQLCAIQKNSSKRHHHIHIYYGAEMEAAIADLQRHMRIPQNAALCDQYSTRFLAIKLIEKDALMTKLALDECANGDEVVAAARRHVNRLEEEFKEDSETIISDAKYGFVAGALKETFRYGKTDRHSHTKKIDSVITSKIFGFPIFLLFMWGMFYTTFALGSYPMEWISSGIDALSDYLTAALSPSLFKDLLIGGVVNGVGSVMAFLPNILILFFFISLFEDTGYMARAVFITDKLMHTIGLHGKSFIPLIMGFGCNVPAIMATRTIENRTQRTLTMLIIPFMSCSARLPVYILLIGAFFPHHAGSMLFLIYLTGIAFAILSALFFSKIMFKDSGQPFVMELPPYRIPTLKSIIRHMWHKGSQYVRQMGGIILTASIVIWALNTFPLNSKRLQRFDTQADAARERCAAALAQPAADSALLVAEMEASLRGIAAERSSARHEHSYLGQLGHAIEPVMRPLGFDWKMSVSLLTGVVAKETVVSTLGIIYQADEEEGSGDGEVNTGRLKQRLRDERYRSGAKEGQPIFSSVTTVAFLVFILLYLPCIAAIAAIRRESGSRWISLFAILYTTAVAWIAAFAVQHIGSWLTQAL